MRIWFGLILKIMVRTKSYILPELCYFTKSIVNTRNYNSFRGLSPVIPQLFEQYNAAALAALAGKVDAINDMYSFVRENNVGRHYKDIVHFDDKGYSKLVGQVVKSIRAVSAKGITGNPSP